MAVYATKADVRAVVSEATLTLIADIDGDGVAEDTAIDAALSEASSIADTYISQYLPLPSVPNALKRAVIDIALQLMRTPREQSTEDSRLAYANAMSWLRDISTAKAQLFPNSPTVDPELEPTAPEVVAECREWTRGTGRRLF